MRLLGGLFTRTAFSSQASSKAGHTHFRIWASPLLHARALVGHQSPRPGRNSRTCNIAAAVQPTKETSPPSPRYPGLGKAVFAHDEVTEIALVIIPVDDRRLSPGSHLLKLALGATVSDRGRTEPSSTRIRRKRVGSSGLGSCADGKWADMKAREHVGGASYRDSRKEEESHGRHLSSISSGQQVLINDRRPLTLSRHPFLLCICCPARIPRLYRILLHCCRSSCKAHPFRITPKGIGTMAD